MNTTTNNPPGPDSTYPSDPLMKYRFFKRLLSANNFVLEEMTALERMIYDSRSFTQDEVSRRIHNLIAACCSLIEDLNALTAGNHSQLFTQTETIAAQATGALARERFTRHSTLVMPLDQISLEHLEEVGGKAANLGEIRNKAGLPTPSGFAVTASAAALFLRESGLLETLTRQLADIDLTDIALLEQHCAKASERIMTAALPKVLEDALQAKTLELVESFGPKVRLAVRSSAVCEDSEASFAGQHASVLGASPQTLARAWSAVVASAFTTRAVFYRRTKGYTEQDVMMSVLVLTMIESKASGVLYTIDPNSACNDDLLLSSAWGLGVSVVDGSSDVDFWRIRRADRKVIQREIACKTEGFVILPQGGIVSRPIDPELQWVPSLTEAQVDTLGLYALQLEKHYGMPLDIEWAVDEEDRIFILQARPLTRAQEVDQVECCGFVPGRTPLLVGGQSASLGVASGPVYHIQSENASLHAIPQGAILVARQTSPAYVAVMGKVAGIITDIGSATGHMASVAREFGIPTLVGVGRATHSLHHGMEITLDATNQAVYAGRIQELLSERKPVNLMQGSPVYKALQDALRFVIPLNLVDPQAAEFSAENCRTLHDIIRFCHEVAMQEMFCIAEDLPHGHGPILELRAGLPFRVLLADLGDGISATAANDVHPEDITCRPLKALLTGMVRLIAEGSRSSANPDWTCHAVISDKYMNFSGRLGHHFATIDAYCGPVINDNYITFSFKGGSAEYEQRVRRSLIIAGVLRRLGFRVTQTGDAIKAEMRKYDERRFLDRLQTLGRLLTAMRRLDVHLDSDDDVTRHVEDFFSQS